MMSRFHFSPSQNTMCHLFRLHSYRHMFPRCSSEMADGATNFSTCHSSCFRSHTGSVCSHGQMSKSSEQRLPRSWVFKELQQHFFLLHGSHHFFVKVFVRDSDADCKCCKPLCYCFRSRATLQRGGWEMGGALILINGGLREGGH